MSHRKALRFGETFASAVAALLLATGCSTPSRQDILPTVPAEQSVLHGWKRCLGGICGKGLVSAYSTFVFVRFDDEPREDVASLSMPGGRHWIEAHYSWGAGVLTGVGNFRNYAFEFEPVPGHAYFIEDLPSGCLVPASGRWISKKKLRVADQDPSGKRTALEIDAVEYCSPEGNVGSCRKDDDCQDDRCTSFGGATGYGLCGALR